MSMGLFEFELAIVDEDGFTLDTRGVAYGQALGSGVGVASKTFHATPATASAMGKSDHGEEQRQGRRSSS
ncbi:hypothetical protein BS17DRAFT_791769 [Gyrodon lividus]|nr:hypothetical protein BS17DRAFT_791769 [Gyrodon lividus]